MTDSARRTIDELLVRYELEPTLADVFVEGSFDKEIYASSFIGASGPAPVIYEIDTVDVPPGLLVQHGLTEGRKQRVIALARELEKGVCQSSYICLVDRDLDHWFGQMEAVFGLRWSKYCSIELHFFSIEFVHAILVLTCKARISNVPEYFSSLSLCLTEIYALRLADRELDWSMRWVPVCSCISESSGGVLMAVDQYVDRLLQCNGKARRKTEFIAIAAQWRNRLGEEPRLHIRGHDFIDVLIWSIGAFRGLKAFANEVAVQRLLVLLARGSIDLQEELRPVLVG